MSKGESKEYRTRLKEITSVLHKYGITRGITPQKLRMILENLGPTYIKIGQIMSLHSDILPKRYCDELMCLRSEVTPMEFPEVKEVIEQVKEDLGSYGRILVRESGTEPLIRVMVEAGTDDLCHKYVDSVVDVMEAEGLIVG